MSSEREHAIEVQIREDEEHGLCVCAPAVGMVSVRVRAGEVLLPGEVVGGLFSLGTMTPLSLPVAVQGRVDRLLLERSAGMVRERVPVAYGAPLFSLVDASAPSLRPVSGADAASSQGGERHVVAPSAGRVYLRPAPEADPFVSVGDELTEGAPLALIEVMKTFHRIHYGGPGLPSEACLSGVLVEDGADVARGERLFSLRPRDSTGT